NKLVAFATNPADQTADVLYAAVGDEFTIPPTPPNGFPGFVPGSGVWRSTDGGRTWTNIVTNPMASPFNTPPNSLAFTDVAVDPTNPNVVYAAIGNFAGDPTNGIYRTLNATAANPSWTLLIGGTGAQFLPGRA